MKKFLALFCAAAVLAFAGMAFAEAGHGGHVVPVTPDTGSYKPLDVTSNDVTIPGVSVDKVEPIRKADIAAKVPAGTKFEIPAGKIPVVQTAVNLSIDLKGATPSSIDITIDLKDTVLPDDVKAYIKNHKAGSTLFGTFVSFATKKAGRKLSFTVTSPDEYFSAADVLFATEKDAPSSGGSSSGCNAGFAGLLILAATPLLYFRKK